MANLTDIVDAVNRLGEKIGQMGGPGQAAAVMQGTTGGAAAMNPGAIGITDPLIDAINRLIDRLGGFGKPAPQKAPTLPGTPTQQPYAISTDVLTGAVVRGVGGVPILREIGQQYLFIRQVMRYLPLFSPQAASMLPSAATPAGTDKSPLLAQIASPTVIDKAKQAWKWLWTPQAKSPASGAGAKAAQAVGNAAAQTTAGAAGGTTMAAGGTGIAAAVAGAMAIPGVNIAVITAAVVTSLAAVGTALVMFGKSISNANRAISGYSAQMASAYAISDIRDVFRDMASAQRRAGAEARFQGAYSNFKDAMRPSLDRLANLFEDLATGLLKVVTPIANAAAWMGDLWDKIPSPLKRAITTYALGPMGFGGQGLTDLATSDQRPNTSINGFSSSTVGQVKFQGISDIEGAVKDAIATMKDLNTTMQKKSKDDGFTSVTAAQFMARVIDAHVGGVQGSGFRPKSTHFGVQKRIGRAVPFSGV